ncbi:MAG: hypothetical protein J6C84_00440 [Lachnospiraceae bacterium]|nr:hypothetical protein [Lachnospiraceae bacterium]
MKKWIYSVGVCIWGMVMLAGCGDGSAEGGIPTRAITMTPEPVRSETEVSTLNYEVKYSSGEFSLEDYHALAALYEEQGLIRKQRDMLEQSYRLYDDKEAFELLQDITVNVAEEEETIQSEVQLMLQNLDTPGYFAESIHQIESPEWFEMMMPKLKEGVRNYYLEEAGEVKIYLRAGYDEEGNCFCSLWYHSGEDDIQVLKYSDGMVQILSTGVEDGVYEGPFTLWVLDGAGGSILKEQGTFAQGIYTGEYTLDIFEGSASGDPYDLWNNRDNLEYVSYTGQADEEGIGELQQFALNLEAYPRFATYSVNAVAENDDPKQGATGESSATAPMVRIFDGQLQWFDGQLWQTLGAAKEYQEQDPFYAYERKNAEKTAGKIPAEEISGGLDLENIQKPEVTPTPEPTSTPKPAATPKPTQKPDTSTPKPAATPKPTPAPTPKPTPTPVPVEEPDDGDDSDDSGSSSDSGSSDSGSSDSGNSDSGSSDSGSESGGSDAGSSDDGSNDADMEWTPDIM